MKTTIQYFSDEYLERCKGMTPTDIVKFLDEFRLIAAGAVDQGTQKLISIRIPEGLLRSFRAKCGLDGRRYQSKIKELMRDWLLDDVSK
jgi:uncharacterized protein (DUF4415 family)